MKHILRVEVLIDADADGVWSHVIQLSAAVEVLEQLVLIWHVARLTHHPVSLRNASMGEVKFR